MSPSSRSDAVALHRLVVSDRVLEPEDGPVDGGGGGVTAEGVVVVSGVHGAGEVR